MPPPYILEPMASEVCQSVKCKHGGTCVPKGSSYECKCILPYKGKHCTDSG